MGRVLGICFYLVSGLDKTTPPPTEVLSQSLGLVFTLLTPGGPLGERI